MLAVVYGAGGHGIEMAQLIQEEKSYSFSGYIDDNIPTGIKLKDLHSSTGIVLGVGDVETRRKIINKCRKYGFSVFPTIIHPATIGIGNIHTYVQSLERYYSSSCEIGMGVTINAGTVLTFGIKIGHYTNINIGCRISHRVKIGDNCMISPGVIICGDCIIGNDVFIGAGSTIIQKIQIGNNVVIGAGSLVTRNIPENTIAYGSPANIQRCGEESI